MTEEHEPEDKPDAEGGKPIVRADKTVFAPAPKPPTLLKALTGYIRSTGLKGKGRDDAADNFMAGVAAAAAVNQNGGLNEIAIPEESGYLAVLEALAD